jgi:predicted acylesterase/phospholipase RssA
MNSKNIAIACQGGGSHAAYAAGVLQELLPAFDKENGLRLVGLSGTSGGAICALLAWYGLLEGGTEAAEKKLDEFWRRNSTKWLGERLFNDWSILALQSLRFEIQFSPYEFPLDRIAMAATEGWPLWAKFMGEYNTWMRGEYFQLGKLVSEHVDFDLIRAVGNFSSICHDIKHWLEADLQHSLLDGVQADQVNPEQTKRWLENRIRANLKMPSEIASLMHAKKFPPQSPLRSAFRAWEKPSTEPSFSTESVTGLSQQVAAVVNQIPQLLIGAVDVGTGEFTAFSSERPADDGGISVKAVLASAALPWIFKAVEIEKKLPDEEFENHLYWDGLFSQNPPVKNFVAGLINENNKPDEIWVAQINPSTYDAKQGPLDIWDRRNELAGNLSLNQEISFIDAINKRIELDGSDTYPRQKHVQVHRIPMDSGAVEREIHAPLGLASKLDRGSHLKDALLAHGKEQATSFLPVRTFLEETFNDHLNGRHLPLDDALIAACDHLYDLVSRFDESCKPHVRLFVDDMEIHPTSGTGVDEAEVKTLWHIRGTTGDEKRQVTLEGTLRFGVKGGGITFAQVADIRVAESREIRRR